VDEEVDEVAVESRTVGIGNEEAATGTAEVDEGERDDENVTKGDGDSDGF